MKNNKIYNMFLALVGIVCGSFVTSLCEGVKGLSWLTFGAVFGTSGPLTLSLGVLELSFGVSIDLTLATIFCIIAALIIGRAVVK